MDPVSVGEATVKLVRYKLAVAEWFQSETGQAFRQYLQAQRTANLEILETTELNNLLKIAKIQGENLILNDILTLPEQLQKLKVKE